MAARRRAATRPLDAALVRLQTMAARGSQPNRMAREVELIVDEWLGEADADPADVKARLDELHEQLASGVVDAEEQVSYVDPDEAAAVKQAGVTLAALVATRDAVERARDAM
ncbi:hypothetical protein [Neoroseomonas soli]|uniref:Uncharacterized protein n=1 Tax=Neoroseomonas soli TaxID=1081025 RepID=A0A9X9X1R3_9PROT|nr:hypothetical protein [Neoroseomonas soli]MBR0673342.1 hypothetical protein [Neoroseomonas soli]